MVSVGSPRPVVVVPATRAAYGLPGALSVVHLAIAGLGALCGLPADDVSVRSGLFLALRLLKVDLAVSEVRGQCLKRVVGRLPGSRVGRGAVRVVVRNGGAKLSRFRPRMSTKRSYIVIRRVFGARDVRWKPFLVVSTDLEITEQIRFAE